MLCQGASYLSKESVSKQQQTCNQFPPGIFSTFWNISNLSRVLETEKHVSVTPPKSGRQTIWSRSVPRLGLMCSSFRGSAMVWHRHRSHRSKVKGHSGGAGGSGGVTRETLPLSGLSPHRREPNRWTSSSLCGTSTPEPPGEDRTHSSKDAPA